MAKNTSLVLLGYFDEQITEKQITFVDYTTNKIGGKPVSIQIFDSLPLFFVFIIVAVVVVVWFIQNSGFICVSTINW